MQRYTSLFLALLATAIATQIVDHDQSNGRIIGGDYAQLGYAPYMASLRSLSNIHFCGGTIVSDRYVLTAAMCTYKRAGASINVVVGTVLRWGGGVPYPSISYVTHPSFNYNTLSNNIALVMTAATIVMTHYVQPASINPFLYENEIAVKMSGWGIVTKEVYDPNNLHSIILDTISNDDCRLYHNNSEYVSHINENKICTAVNEKICEEDEDGDEICSSIQTGKGICFGDEGGAIISGSEIIGVASWHSYCETDVPNVYERVAPHRLWILSYIVI